MPNNIKSERVRMDMTQSILARKLGVTPATLGNWETGKIDPSSSALKEMAVIFDTTIDYLLGLTDERTRT